MGVERPVTTTDAGIPAASDEFSLTVCPGRPTVLHDAYVKDGPLAYRHAGSQPTYAPNSYGGPQADPDRARDLGWWVEAAEIGRYAYEEHAEDDDFVQPRAVPRRDDRHRPGAPDHQHRQPRQGRRETSRGAAGDRVLAERSP